jgi:hypothetical protein
MARTPLTIQPAMVLDIKLKEALLRYCRGKTSFSLIYLS